MVLYLPDLRRSHGRITQFSGQTVAGDGSSTSGARTRFRSVGRKTPGIITQHKISIRFFAKGSSGSRTDLLSVRVPLRRYVKSALAAHSSVVEPYVTRAHFQCISRAFLRSTIRLSVTTFVRGRLANLVTASQVGLLPQTAACVSGSMRDGYPSRHARQNQRRLHAQRVGFSNRAAFQHVQRPRRRRTGSWWFRNALSAAAH